MSLGSILSVAAPIAAGYFTGGAGGTSLFGLEATGSAIAAGALTGAGIAALSGGDILTSAAMGGLGGYGGGELGAAFNPAGASGIASATGTTNAAVNQAAMSNMTGSALGQGGFNTAAGRGLMGVATPGMAGAAGQREHRTTKCYCREYRTRFFPICYSRYFRRICNSIFNYMQV